MALSAASMAAFIEGHLAGVSHAQTSAAGSAETHRNACLLALCQGIIDEIVANAIVETTSGAPDAEHIGIVY
jgi:hypothetical protein